MPSPEPTAIPWVLLVRLSGSPAPAASRFLTAGRNVAQQAGQLAASGRNVVGAAAAGYEAFIAGRAALGAARLDALKGAFGAALGALAPEFSMTGGGDMQLVRNLPFWIGTTFRTYEAIACSVNAVTK